MKKPWSGRFSEETAASVEAFTESVSFDQRLWRYDIEGSIAHAKMLSHKGIIPKSDMRLIIGGLEEIAEEITRGKFTFREDLEDIHMNIEAALIDKVGPRGGRLHTGRSRNDQIALDLRLYLRDEIKATAELIRKLQRALLKKAEKHDDIIMPGYTHLQRAQPVLLSHHLLAYVEMFEGDRSRLIDSYGRVNVLPLGSAALAGTSLPIDRRFVARLLGFKGTTPNSMDSVSSRDAAIEFVSNASIIMMHLSRLSEELVLWSSEEFSFIELPDAYTTGSSIMPQKKNPDIPELIRGKTGSVYGDLMNLLTIMKGLPMAYNRDMQEDKPPVFHAADTVKASLGLMGEMAPLITYNKKRMFDAVSSSYATATDAAEYLVGKGVPFREAHEAVGKMVLHAIKEEKRLEELTMEELRGFSKKFDEDLLERLTPEGSLKSRLSEGGTSPESVRKQILRYKTLLAKSGFAGV